MNLLTKIKEIIIYSRFGRNFRPDTPKFALYFYNFMTFLHRKEFLERQKYCKEIKNKIEDKKGFEIFNQSLIFDDNLSQDALKTLKKNYYKVDWQNELNFKKNFLKIKEIDFSIELKILTLKLIPIITNYLGSLAILQDASFWYSSNTDRVEGRSQNWHMDAEDLKQVRVLIPIEEVDENSGPLTVINAEDTSEIFKNLNKKNIVKVRNQKIPDEIIDQFNAKQNKIIIKENEIAFVDTCNCYHYGSRKSKKPRKLLALQFTSAFSIFTPIFRRQTTLTGFGDRKSQLIFCFLKDNFKKIKNIKLKKWQIKIL